MLRVGRLWDWLPAFRAVAETQHLGRAAERLHVTPPALSRTLKILEQDLGQPLFERTGRSLVLNPAGERLLVAVRRAMRVVHDAVGDIEGGAREELTVASSGIFTATALQPTLSRLLESHPRVRPRVSTAGSSDPGADLLVGDIDLLFTSSPLFHAGLTTVVLCRVTTGVYAGPGHPLHGRTRATPDELADHPFVAPAPDDSGAPTDGWPGDWPRRVAIEVDRQAVGMDVCAGGRLLAVLPDLVSPSHPSLFRLPVDLPSVTTLRAVHRETVGLPGPVEAAVAHAADVLRTAASGIVQ